MEKGNVYSTSANLEESVTPFCVFTFFITSARVRHKIIGDENAVLPNFIEALHSFSKTGFVDNELETEKNNLYRAETIDIKNSDLAVNNGMHYIFGETVVEQHKNGYDDYFNTYIKPITNNDVIRVFNTYFTKEWIIDLSILSNKTAAKYISNYAFT
jgi:predicted Zn-dependent peptidase